MLIDRLRNAVNTTVVEFRERPVDFLSERDIQSLLFAELRRDLSDPRYRVDVKDVKDVKDRFGDIDFPAINPVKTEYQLDAKGSGPRVDIAVLSENLDRGSNIWRQPCRAAIEIKLWQPGGPWGDPWSDVEKLKSYLQARNSDAPFIGIAMLFVHPAAKRWEELMQDIEQQLKENTDVSPITDIPSDGIALHLINPDWKQFSISSQRGVPTLNEGLIERL